MDGRQSNAQPRRADMRMRIFAALVLIGLVPPMVLFGLFAATFLVQEFVNGWIPSKWFSSSATDWAFGSGTEGGARNYLGFMLSAVPAATCWQGVKWAKAKLATEVINAAAERKM